MSPRRADGRLRAGVSGALAIAAACLVGPVLLGPGPAGDPVRGSLLPPGTRVEVVTTRDGRVVAGRTAEPAPDGSLELSTPGRAPRRISAGEVAERSRHRFWLGSDRYGRDVLRLMLVGGRLSLAIVAASLAVALLLGLGTGLAAATGGPVVDAVLMRLVDALLAFPVLLLLVLASAVMRPGPLLLVALLGATSWMGLARLVRGQVLEVRVRPFLLASRLAGTPWYRAWRLHYLPNVAVPVSQDASLRLADLIIAEATLSFLGLGVPPTLPTWGALVAEGQRAPAQGWWLVLLPGAALVALVVSLALIADGVGERLESPERPLESAETAPSLR